MCGPLKHILGSVCLLGFLFVLPGCDQQPEAPKKPKVISKKIVRGKEAPRRSAPAAEGKAAESRKPSAPEKAPEPVVSEKTPAPEKAPKAVESGKPPASDTAPEPKIAGEEPPPAEDEPDAKSGIVRRKIPARDTGDKPGKVREEVAEAPMGDEGAESTEKAPATPRKKAFQPKSDIALVTKKTLDKGLSTPGKPNASFAPSGYAYSYNPEGKIDPFAPIFRKETTEKSPTEKKMLKRKVHIPKTPLERIDISQLKLTAVITAPSGNKALVEEATGKGYVVKLGTGIGTRWGKVVEIQQDRIIVEEETQDAMGNWTKRKREIKLQKPIGD